MSDVDRVIQAISELPLTASVNDLMTYIPSVVKDRDVPKKDEEPDGPDLEGQDQATDD